MKIQLDNEQFLFPLPRHTPHSKAVITGIYFWFKLYSKLFPNLRPATNPSLYLIGRHKT